MSRFQPVHTTEFHTALEQMGTVEQLLDSGVEYADMVTETQQRTNLSAEGVALSVSLEACGCVSGEELGMQLADTVTIQRGGYQQKISPDKSNEFLVAFFS